jgi:uncharacterized protein with ParB-like and HNH nuclease domain
MGAMVISQLKTFGKEVQANEVIDGQQRLTPFQLLLAALRDVAAVNGSSRPNETDLWPNDNEFRQGWLGRDQFKNARQPRLRYTFEHLEQAKRATLSEDIEIKSALTIDHIMHKRPFRKGLSG